MAEQLVDSDKRVALGLPKRPPKPEVTVAAVHPEVLGMWADARFGPWDVASTSAVKIRWVCPVGHRFLASAHVQCGSVAGWRNRAGGTRACYACYAATLPAGVDAPPQRKPRAPKVHGPRKPTPALHPVGTVVLSRSTAGSATEEMVRTKLEDAGISLRMDRLAIQCGLEPGRGNHPLLTPDFLVEGANVCIEIDPGRTHKHRTDADRLRNQLLADVGWTVVRLRMAGQEPLGPHDVVAATEHVGQAAVDALADAVRDAVAGRPGIIRRIALKPSLARAKSRLGAVAAHTHFDRAFYVSWTLDSGDVLRLVAMDGGRYLGAATGWSVPHYVCDLGLHELPRTKWRKHLQEVLERREAGPGFAPVARYPWGDELFTGPEAAAVIVHPKMNVGSTSIATTANLEGPDEFEDDRISRDGVVLVVLHPGAVAAGWRIAGVHATTGFRGSYQQILLERIVG